MLLFCSPRKKGVDDDDDDDDDVRQTWPRGPILITQTNDSEAGIHNLHLLGDTLSLIKR